MLARIALKAQYKIFADPWFRAKFVSNKRATSSLRLEFSSASLRSSATCHGGKDIGGKDSESLKRPKRNWLRTHDGLDRWMALPSDSCMSDTIADFEDTVDGRRITNHR